MEAKLIVVGGKANRSEVPLKLPAMLGRGRDADITVAHPTVSRHHCLIYEVEGALVVKDNGSLNGTMVAGERVEEAVLPPGRTLTVGPLTFRAEYAHTGEFPDLGPGRASPRKPAEMAPANDELKFAEEHDLISGEEQDLKFSEEPDLKFADDPVAVPSKAKEVAPASDLLPVADDDEPADDFSFLDDEPSPAPVPARRPAPMNAHDESEPAEQSDVFRLAEEPLADMPLDETISPPTAPPTKKAAAAAPSMNGSAPNGSAPKGAQRKQPADRARGEAPAAAMPEGAAKSADADDDDLSSFLDSLGLEE
jgi:hypothetical protein